jgi:hypothetical protein
MGHSLKLPSPTKLAWLWVIFLQLARRAALPARCSTLHLFSVYEGVGMEGGGRMAKGGSPWKRKECGKIKNKWRKKLTERKRQNL